MKLIKKLVNLQKNSFTLIETLISLTILLIVLAIFNQISKDNLEEDKIFNLLNSLENSFELKNYSNLQKFSKNINIIRNENIIESININVYTYKDENIKIFKYEK